MGVALEMVVAGREYTSAPLVILDGMVVLWGDPAPAGRSGIDDVRIVDPITYEEGPERCGAGSVTVTGGRIRVSTSGCTGYDLVATTGDESRWWNYGAPHGTHVRAVIRWVFPAR